jgi:hypothetical protein
MLDWLTGRSRKADHPMHCIEEAERLLTGLSDEPLNALEEVASWLSTLAQAAGFELATRLAVIRLVDETGQPFEPELIRLYLMQRTLTQFERLQMWRAALHFWERSEHAYRVCLDEIQKNPKLLRAHHGDLPLLFVRMVRALASQARLLHLRYIPVRVPVWQSLFDAYQASEQTGCANQRVIAYPGNAAHTTAQQELLRAVMLEIARPDSMLPQQTDIAARIVARYANACGFDQKPKPGCIWAIDLAQPRPPELVTGVATSQLTARFFGAGAATVKIQEVIRRLAADLNAKEQRFGTEYTSPEKLAVLRRLTLYWGEQPPQRGEKRGKSAAAIDVVLGFADACRLIPRAAYRDWVKLIRGLDVKLMERLGVAADPAEFPVVEKWLRHDASTWGLGATIPRTCEPRVKLGTLCAVKTGAIAWSVGVVRRLFCDDEVHAQAGIEVLAKTPATVLLRKVGHGGMRMQDWSKASDASGNDYVNVLLLGATRAAQQRHELLVARGEFIAGIIYEAMIGDGQQHFQFDELLEQGEDFDRVRFTRISAQPGDGIPETLLR